MCVGEVDVWVIVGSFTKSSRRWTRLQFHFRVNVSSNIQPKSVYSANRYIISIFFLQRMCWETILAKFSWTVRAEESKAKNVDSCRNQKSVYILPIFFLVLSYFFHSLCQGKLKIVIDTLRDSCKQKRLGHAKKNIMYSNLSNLHFVPIVISRWTNFAIALKSLKTKNKTILPRQPRFLQPN